MFLFLLGLPLGLLLYPLTGREACKQGYYRPYSRWLPPNDRQRLPNHHFLLRLLEERPAAEPLALLGRQLLRDMQHYEPSDHTSRCGTIAIWHKLLFLQLGPNPQSPPPHSQPCSRAAGGCEYGGGDGGCGPSGRKSSLCRIAIVPQGLV